LGQPCNFYAAVAADKVFENAGELQKLLQVPPGTRSFTAGAACCTAAAAVAAPACTTAAAATTTTVAASSGTQLAQRRRALARPPDTFAYQAFCVPERKIFDSKLLLRWISNFS
jgi:hypothetical protein